MTNGPELTAPAGDVSPAGRPRHHEGGQAYARAVLAGLDEADVRWCLLRGGTDGLGSGDDVDVLVAADDLPRAIEVIESHGCMRLPSYGRGTHRFFLGFDQSTRTWVEFDLVTEIAYGRHFEVRTYAERECLQRRRRRRGLWTLAPADEFWALLLHCVLDKGVVSDRHLDRLMRLRSAASPSSPVVRAMPSMVDLTPLESGTADAGPALATQRAALLASWRRAHPVTAAWRAVATSASRLVERPLQIRSRRGISVALLGPDGAGKSTLATGIEAAYYFPVRRVYMGLWSLGAQPRGRIAKALRIILRPTVVWRRYLTALVHRARGRLVVFDRYVYDALLPPRGRLGWLKRPYFWLLSRLCPAPDLVVLLDAPGPVMHQRSGEYDPEHLEAERAHYQSLRLRIPQLQVVDASRAADLVLTDVLQRIWQHYVGRAAR